MFTYIHVSTCKLIGSHGDYPNKEADVRSRAVIDTSATNYRLLGQTILRLPYPAVVKALVSRVPTEIRTWQHT